MSHYKICNDIHNKEKTGNESELMTRVSHILPEKIGKEAYRYL